MVQVMRYSNCRAEDAVSLRGCDLRTAGDVWEYRPASHKHQWREEDAPTHRRVVHLGPRCQGILRPFLKDDPQAYLFSPQDARAEYQARRAAARKSKRTPSESRRKRSSRPPAVTRDLLHGELLPAGDSARLRQAGGTALDGAAGATHAGRVGARATAPGALRRRWVTRSRQPNSTPSATATWPAASPGSSANRLGGLRRRGAVIMTSG
jgi:hypothetical protein